ncbi:MAG: thioredoxin family protein [Hyphomicrobiaceae bacterium]
MSRDTPICEFGWKASPFSLFDFDGREISLNDLKGDKGFLLAFICNHCPYVQAIIERLVEDVKALQESGIKVAAVMPNDYRAYTSDHPSKMKKFSEQFAMTFPYLVDEGGKVARDYGAVCTPEFFGFNANAELQYRGRIDDMGMGDPTSRTPELLVAMKMIAETGVGPQIQFPSVGCSIKW